MRLTLADEAGAARLVLTWAHPLMDPHGSEHLLRLLAELDEHAAVRRRGRAPRSLVAPPETRSLRERGALASRGAAQLKSLAPVAPISLAAARGNADGAASAPTLPLRRRPHPPPIASAAACRGGSRSSPKP